MRLRTGHRKRVGSCSSSRLAVDSECHVAVLQDPFMLEKCVVTVDPDCDDVFELQEWGREAYIFKVIMMID